MRKTLILALFIAFTSVAMASAEDDPTSLSYISYLERYATVQPANQDENLEAVINMPLVDGDRVDTAREARMEVVLADGNTLWLDEYTTVSFDAVAFSRDSEAERTVIFLAEGSVMLEIAEYELADKPTRVDSRGATVYLDATGLYRLQALPTGGLRVEVVSGLAEAATTSGGVLIRSETAAEVDGGQVQRTESNLSSGDDFASWVEMRRQVAAGESLEHLEARYSREGALLDSYGSWVYVDSINSWAWQPIVGADWRPYTAGRWYWTPTGYAWISYEPWGWLPYHYGSWHFSIGFGWVWASGSYWGPSWVSWIRWPGYIGWSPYGYYDYWYWGYYPGYYPPYYPGYPGGGGGGYAQPPRRDVMPPPRAANTRVTPDGATVGAASRPALDLNGRVRVAAVDRRGWTVVSDRDFASPHLTRLAKPGERVMPSDGDQMGVVMTGPLTTRSPRVASASDEIDRVFRDVESRATADISRLMARDSSLSPDAARSMGKPTTVAEISRRSTAAAASNRRTLYPTLTTRAASPFSTDDGGRRPGPNLYRPAQTSGSSVLAGSGGAATRDGGRQLVAPRGASGQIGSRSPVIFPHTSSSRQTGPRGAATRSPTSVRRPSSSSSGSSSRGATTRAPSTRSSSSSRSSAPRTSSAGSTRSSGGSHSSGGGSSSRSSSGHSSGGAVRK